MTSSSTPTPREKLRAAKEKFDKAKQTYAKAQESWQKSRREFTDSLTFGREVAAEQTAADETEESNDD